MGQVIYLLLVSFQYVTNACISASIPTKYHIYLDNNYLGTQLILVLIINYSLEHCPSMEIPSRDFYVTANALIRHVHKNLILNSTDGKERWTGAVENSTWRSTCSPTHSSSSTDVLQMFQCDVRGHDICFSYWHHTSSETR